MILRTFIVFFEVIDLPKWKEEYHKLRESDLQKRHEAFHLNLTKIYSWCFKRGKREPEQLDILRDQIPLLDNLDAFQYLLH